MIKILILSLIFTIIDQLSKYLIVHYLVNTHSITIINNFFSLTYTNNTGAAFSILTGKRIFLIIISLLVIFLILFYIKRNKLNKISTLAFSLVLGGSLGNLIDRLLKGYVVDFLSFKFFNYNFPIFNLADSFITIGVILLLFTRKE